MRPPVLALPERVQLLVGQQPAPFPPAPVSASWAGSPWPPAPDAVDADPQVARRSCICRLVDLALELLVVATLGALDPAADQRDRVDRALDLRRAPAASPRSGSARRAASASQVACDIRTTASVPAVARGGIARLRSEPSSTSTYQVPPSPVSSLVSRTSCRSCGRASTPARSRTGARGRAGRGPGSTPARAMSRIVTSPAIFRSFSARRRLPRSRSRPFEHQPDRARSGGEPHERARIGAQLEVDVAVRHRRRSPRCRGAAFAH